MIKFASLFSGGGGADQGAITAGCEHIWGLEYDPKIAAVYKQNIGHCFVEDVLASDPTTKPRPDWLHASPVCKNFSSAKTNGKETDWDIQCGQKVAEYIRVLQPQYFSLENVRAYQGAIAYRIIVDELNTLGYHCHSAILNAADYGVPQSRERLFLVAHKDFRWGFDPFHTTAKPIGWYEAIADLLDDCPETKLTDWQIKRFNAAIDKNQKLDLPLLFGGSNKSQSFLDFAINHRPSITGIKSRTDTAGTIPADTAVQSTYKALLVESIGSRSDRPLQYRKEGEPSWTIRALSDKHWHKSTALTQGRVVQLTPRCLARLQGFPDSYQLPKSKPLAGTIIGNSVPPPLMETIIKSTIS